MLSVTYAAQAVEALEWAPIRVLYSTILVDGVFFLGVGVYALLRIWRKRRNKDDES